MNIPTYYNNGKNTHTAARLHNELRHEAQVDLLDIPGKGQCSVFISRFAYDPPE